MTSLLAVTLLLCCHSVQGFLINQLPGLIASETNHQCSRLSSSLLDSDGDTGYSRRQILSGVSSALLSQLCTSQSAWGQLVQFPSPKLANTYHFMRVGVTQLEAQDVWSTNPLFLTNREDCLSTHGRDQIMESCLSLKDESVRPTIVKYGLGAASMDTADIIGQQLQIGRERLVPEYTYLDPRSIGLWDRRKKSEYEPAVWALDAYGGRLPEHIDGTSNESVQEPMVRLRQLMSVLETHYSGDTILLIFADGTTPAILSCMMAGISLNACHALEFSPGELRQDVTESKIKALYEQRRKDKEYLSKLEKGQVELKQFLKYEQDLIAQEQLPPPKPAAAEVKKEHQIPTSSTTSGGFRFNRVESIEGMDNERGAVPDNVASAMAVALAGSVVFPSTIRKEDSDEDDQNTDTPEPVIRARPALSFSNATMAMEAPVSSSLATLNVQESTIAPVLAPREAAPLTKDIDTVAAEKAAEESMKAYLDLDSGESDWLDSIQEILDETPSDDE